MWMTHLVIVVLALVLFGAPSSAAAQAPGKVHQIGVLGTREGPSKVTSAWLEPSAWSSRWRFSRESIN
jgi:hypothetical protein